MSLVSGIIFINGAINREHFCFSVFEWEQEIYCAVIERP
ncbi:hypothetical protein ETAE_2028 [Edwardsiella piscicida]|uniref:Uncharacterized protein n=1 Tax=Edwardsiella piscicida TaxID=1263550 RepID=A0AAU8P5X9_EDWPI|nr:hypothetical protein ETAE_2028 [Edwardsiella tarda EIB202]